MTEHARELIQIFDAKKLDRGSKYGLAYAKLRMWQSYYETVVGHSKGNPNIISMAFTQKLLAYVGIAESLFPQKWNQDKKVRTFFDLLDGPTKLLLLFAIQYGRSGAERRKREKRILTAIARHRKKALAKLFAEIIYAEKARNKTQRSRALLNLRHGLIHRGEYVTTMVRGLSNEVLALRSPDWYLAIDERIISLDELFLRGIAHRARLKIPSLNARLRSFLIGHSWYRFGASGKPVTAVFSSI